MQSIPMAEDRISALADPILFQIVSSLQTKHAAATSVLSKRWSRLWLSLLSLQFNDQLVLDSSPPWVRIAKFLDADLIWTYSSNIPTLQNITKLEFIFKSETWRSRWNWVAQVIQHCPSLECLKIDDEACKYEQGIGDGDWKEPESFPTRLSSQFTECKLKGYKGYQCQFEFAKFLLLNAKMLHTLKIKTTCSDEDVNYEMERRLKSFYCLWANNTCKVTFKFPLEW